MNSSDLTVKGIVNQYDDKVPTIRCFTLLDNKSAYLPPIYCKHKREYDNIAFPEPSMTLRPEQDKVLTEFDKIIDGQKNRVCHTVFGHIYTGFGKTVIATTFAMKKKLPILVIVNSDAIRKGWINTFTTQGITPHLPSGPKLGKYDVCILSIQLAVKHKYTRDEYTHYGTIILDEADTLCTQLAVDEMLKMYPKYMIGLSATVTRQDGMHKVLDIFWGTRKDWVIRQKSFDETCSMTMKILYTPFMVEGRRNKKNALDWMSMSSDVMNIDDRNILIRNLCLLHQDKKILILCKRKEHVEILASMLQDIGEDVSTYFGTDKSYYDAHILIATLAKAGRGYDDKQVSSAFDGRRFNMLILTMTMKDADQAIGRGLRGDNLLLYVLCDNNSTMKSHIDSMKRINQKRGATIIEEHV